MSQGKNQTLIILLCAVFCGALLFILALGLTMNPQQNTSALIDQPAKPFRVTRLQGGDNLGVGDRVSFGLEDFQGKPFVLNFWASWCQSCREEAREFERFWQDHQAEGMTVVGIAIQDQAEAALGFARTYGKTYLLGLDENGRASIDYGVAGVPETFFIDKNGIIKKKHTGPISAEILLKNFQELL